MSGSRSGANRSHEFAPPFAVARAGKGFGGENRLGGAETKCERGHLNPWRRPK